LTTRHPLRSDSGGALRHAKLVGIDKIGENYQLTFADGRVVTTAV